MTHNRYQMCARCVMDTTDPLISFDENGECNHCRRAQQELRNGWFPDERGAALLQSISADIRKHGKGKEYDCVIGVSGGVDSSYLLHVAKTIMGLRPLAVHVDAGWDSEIAVKNIENLIKALDIDLFTHVVDWEEVKDLQLAFLKSSVANQDIPQDHAFSSKVYELAIEYRIRYVVTGGNLTSESILPAAWGYDSKDKRQLIGIHHQFGSRKLNSFPTMSFFKYYLYWPLVKRMKRIRPLNYLDYSKEKAIQSLQDLYGWRYYGGKHYESRWTKFFQSYYLPEKFGYDKRKAHLSSLIVAGQMNRDDALTQLAETPFDPKETQIEKAYVARKLGITPAELDQLIARPNKTYKDYPNNQALIKVLRSTRRKVRNVMSASRF